MAGSYGAAQQFGEDGQTLGGQSPFSVILMESGDPRQELETVARTLALWERGRGPLASSPWPGWEAVAVTVPRGRLAQAREVFSRYRLPCRWNTREYVLCWTGEQSPRLRSDPEMCAYGSR